MHNSERSHQMRGLLGTILQFRFLVVVFAAMLMVFGILQLRHMPVDVLPEFSPPYVEIQTEALGLSAEEVEQLITVPLEHNLLNGVAWIDKIRSESVSGLSSVTLIFEPGTDLYRARQMVAERLAQGAATLPRVSRGPVMLQPTSGSSRVLVVRLSSKQLSAIQMSVLARWTITPRLMGVPGVANVAVWGMRDRQLQVLVDPDRLRAYQIPLLQVLESVGNALWVSPLSFVEAATPGNAGFIDTPQQRLGIQHISPIVSPESLSQVSVQAPLTLLINQPEGNKSSTPVWGGAVRVMDVADVVENHQPLIGDALAKDGANLLLVIEKFPGSDTVQVTRGVEAALATLRPGLGGMEIDSTLFRPATFIELARNNLTRAGIIAGVIIVLMVGLFFFNWRATLISLITIPLAQARLVPRPSLIRHEDVSRYVDIGVNVTGRNARSVMADIQTRLRQFQFPLEYHAKVFGEFERQQAARNRFLAFGAIAFIGVLLLLQAAYESWRLALLSLLTLPLALVGGLVALAAAAQSISLGAVFGLLTVLDLAARNQILLIRRLRQLEQEQGQPSSPELVLQGTRERFASSLMTALTLGLAVLPLLLLGDIPGFEILRPTALVILSGMVTCTLVDLFVVPTLYWQMAKLNVPAKHVRSGEPVSNA